MGKKIIISEKSFRNIVTEKVDNDVLYICLLLDENSSSKLKALSERLLNESPKGGTKIFCHHMTIAFKTNISDELMEWAHENEGKRYSATAVRLGQSDKACAVEIRTECPSMNSLKHVTLFTMNGGKPFDSNAIEEWHPIKPIELSGEVRIMRKS